MDSPNNNPLWLQTPLIRSSHISSVLGSDAYLKLENLQPPHSFKARGLSHFIQRRVAERGQSVHLVIASGGNAGLAAAWAAQKLGVRCTVYLPEGASQKTIDFLKKYGAEVVLHGAFYVDALHKAEEAAKNDPNGVKVPAYDDPIVWQGHSSMITEISQQLLGDPAVASSKPDAIVCSVGGGGLLAGVIVGCAQTGWDDVPIIAVETHGSNCFYESMMLNRDPARREQPPSNAEPIFNEEHDVHVARLKHLTSKATSLGAASPSAGVVKLALGRKGPVKCLTVSDEMTMWAAERIADDHKFLVELACSATLTPAYNRELFERLVPRGSSSPRTAVFVACGGFLTSISDLVSYQEVAGKELLERRDIPWTVFCDGEKWDIPKQ